MNVINPALRCRIFYVERKKRRTGAADENAIFDGVKRIANTLSFFVVSMYDKGEISGMGNHNQSNPMDSSGSRLLSLI